MLLHLQPFAFLQAPVHISHDLLFHPAATHDVLPFWPTSIASRAAPRGGLVPPAAFRKPETRAISARSPSIPKSSKSPRNPAPDTYAAAPPRAASPVVFYSHDAASSAIYTLSYATLCLLAPVLRGRTAEYRKELADYMTRA